MLSPAAGVVTDGSIRDLGVMVQEEFGLIIYARDRTPRGGVPYAVPAQENVDIQCGGALVRPGDVLVGDDDGVVVVPSWFAEECVELTEEYEAVETRTQERILAEGAVPGQYYTPPGRPGSRKRRPFAAIHDGFTAQQSRSRREQHRHGSGRGGLRDCPAVVADPARRLEIALASPLCACAFSPGFMVSSSNSISPSGTGGGQVLSTGERVLSQFPGSGHAWQRVPIACDHVGDDGSVEWLEVCIHCYAERRMAKRPNGQSRVIRTDPDPLPLPCIRDSRRSAIVRGDPN